MEPERIVCPVARCDNDLTNFAFEIESIDGWCPRHGLTMWDLDDFEYYFKCTPESFQASLEAEEE